MRRDNRTRACSICGGDKEGTVNRYCAKCERDYKKKKREKDPAGVLRKERGYFFKRTYGITLDEYDELLAKQRGVCDCCKEAPRNTNQKDKHLYVDHDHATGKVRGLLCHRCNIMLGNARENIETLENAVMYLLKHRSDPTSDS